MLSKVTTLSPLDAVIYDLEDAVSPSMKSEARKLLKAHLSRRDRDAHIRENIVRINAVDTGLALDDLTAALSAPLVDTIAVPKVHSAADLHFINDVIQHLRPDKDISILALIESARAITDLNAICSATPLLSGLIFASEDFALDLSITRTPTLTEFLYARSHIVAAARAHNLPSTIDLVCTSFRGLEGQATMEAECVGGKLLGFNGKQCIHPSQVDLAQRVFSPQQEELVWAIRVAIAERKAEQQRRGAWALAGKMIDIPVVRKAKGIVERAAMCGMNIDELKEKWKDQEPE